MENKVALFDIDGVLCEPGPRSHMESFSFAIKKIFDVNASIYDIDFTGMTDRGIILSLLKNHGFNNADIIQKIDLVFSEMARYVRENTKEGDIKIIPYAKEAVAALANKEIILGVVTGNHAAAAKIKLEAAGLSDFMKFVACGNLTETRSELFDIIIDDISKKLNIKINRRDVFYFDDSWRGILAGKEAGIKTIAVATGKYTISELQNYNPDFLLENLNDVEKLNDIFQI